MFQSIASVLRNVLQTQHLVMVYQTNHCLQNDVYSIYSLANVFFLDE